MAVVCEFTPRKDTSVSPSQIQTFLLCPLKYRFVYVDRIPRPWKSASLAFGSAIHSALEAWQSARLSGEDMPESEVIKLFHADFEAEKAGGVKFKDDGDGSELVEKGQTLLSLAMNVLRPDPPQAVELPFEIDLVHPDTNEPTGLELRGVFDLVLSNDRLVEIKTAARKWDHDMLASNTQLTAYHLAYETVMGKQPSMQVLTLLKTKKPEAIMLRATRTHNDHARFTRLCLNVHRAVQNNIFYPIHGHMCADCEYAECCQEWKG